MAFPARNYDEEQPVSQQTFRAYQSLYSYDKIALSPSIESIDESNEDGKEKITFAAAYGNERVIASLFLPKKFLAPLSSHYLFSLRCISPPFQRRQPRWQSWVDRLHHQKWQGRLISCLQRYS